jgi:transcriptional regulator with XRE-family HTH domain
MSEEPGTGEPAADLGDGGDDLEQRDEDLDERDVDARLAARLAKLRADRGWSLAELADRTGASRSTLSRVERGEVSPTATLLGRLAAAYERTASRLLVEIESQPSPLIRAADQAVWRDQQEGFVRRSISPPHAALRGEVVEGLLGPGADISYDRPPVAGMEQHLWLLAGSLEFTADEESFVLLPGDCVRLRLWGRTRLRCLSPEPARYGIFIVL